MSKQHLRTLTEEQVAQFKLNGFLTVENVLTSGITNFPSFQFLHWVFPVKSRSAHKPWHKTPHTYHGIELLASRGRLRNGFVLST